MHATVRLIYLVDLVWFGLVFAWDWDNKINVCLWQKKMGFDSMWHTAHATWHIYIYVYYSCILVAFHCRCRFRCCRCCRCCCHCSYARLAVSTPLACTFSSSIVHAQSNSLTRIKMIKTTLQNDNNKKKYINNNTNSARCIGKEKGKDSVNSFAAVGLSHSLTLRFNGDTMAERHKSKRFCRVSNTIRNWC